MNLEVIMNKKRIITLTFALVLAFTLSIMPAYADLGDKYTITLKYYDKLLLNYSIYYADDTLH